MSMPTVGAIYDGFGGRRRVKWVAAATVCYQIPWSGGGWSKHGLSVSLDAWVAWAAGLEEEAPARAAPFVCPSCGEESDHDTPASQRNHTATCRSRPRTTAALKVGQVYHVVVCTMCRAHWVISPPWPLDKRQKEAGLLWMHRHERPNGGKCDGFWLDVLDIKRLTLQRENAA